MVVGDALLVTKRRGVAPPSPRDGRGMPSGRAERVKALRWPVTSKNVLEAASGIEPLYRALQALA